MPKCEHQLKLADHNRNRRREIRERLFETNLAKRSGSVNDIGIHHEYEILIHQCSLVIRTHMLSKEEG